MCGSTDSRAPRSYSGAATRPRPAEPAGAHPDGAVPEPGPVEVVARGADGNGGRAGELHGAGVGVRHPRIAPIAGERLHPVVAEVDGEQAATVVVDPRRHEGVRADARTRTPHLGAVERHLVAVTACDHGGITLTRLPRHPTTDRVWVRGRAIRRGSRRRRCAPRPVGPPPRRLRSARPVDATGARSDPTRQREVQFARGEPAPDETALMSGRRPSAFNAECDSSRRWCANPPGARPSRRSEVATDSVASRWIAGPAASNRSTSSTSSPVGSARKPPTAQYASARNPMFAP